MVITANGNARVKEIYALKDKKTRSETGLYIAEGIKTVREALSLGKEAVKIVCTEKGLAELGDIGFSGEIITVSDGVFAHLSDEVTPQGALAVLKQEYHSGAADGRCVLLDGVSDPGNLGTIMRTSAAAGVTDIYLKDCCDPYSPKAVRSSMGGVFRVKLYPVKGEEIDDILGDIPLIAADMNGESVFTFDPPEKFCLAIGNEGRGLSETVKKRADKTISVPMKNGVESLNAGVSHAVIIYILNESRF